MIYEKLYGWNHTWSKWFAWHPVKLIDGRHAWIEPVERISYFSPEIDPSAPFFPRLFSFDAWCYREPIE